MGVLLPGLSLGSGLVGHSPVPGPRPEEGLPGPKKDPSVGWGVVTEPPPPFAYSTRYARSRTLHIDWTWPYKGTFTTCWDRLQVTFALT